MTGGRASLAWVLAHRRPDLLPAPGSAAGVRCQRCDSRSARRACTRPRWVPLPRVRQGRPAEGDAGGRPGPPCPCTIGLVAANLAIYVSGMFTGGRGRGRVVPQGGALRAGRGRRRLVATDHVGFLHVSLLHVGFNMFLLYQLGLLLEPAVKRWAFSALYLLSLLGGSFLVLVIDPDRPTVGASGAVFGLMAAFIAMRSRGHRPVRDRHRGPLIVINLIFTFVARDVSIGGHLGGLIAGAIGGWILWYWSPAWASSPLPVAACLGLAAALRRLPLRRVSPAQPGTSSGWASRRSRSPPGRTPTRAPPATRR